MSDVCVGLFCVLLVAVFVGGVGMFLREQWREWSQRKSGGGSSDA